MIALVGLGLIGGSLALALRRGMPGIPLIGIDSNPLACQQALAAQAVDAASSIAGAPLERCDLVVLALPAQALLEALPGVAARMRPGAVLTDVCGAKERICAAGAAQDRVVFVGAHPMAGTEFRGFPAAQAGLFAGATVAICPPAPAPGAAEATRAVRDLWLAAGAGKLLEVTPAEHDRAVAFASHLPYLAAASVVDALLSAGPSAGLARELAAGGFRDTTRLGGDGTIGGAAALNGFVPELARALADRLHALAVQLEGDPQAALERLEALADERRRMRLPPAAR